MPIGGAKHDVCGGSTRCRYQGKRQSKKEEGDVGRAMVASEELGMVTRFRLAAFTIHASDEAAAGYSASERERLGTRFETSKRI